MESPAQPPGGSSGDSQLSASCPWPWQDLPVGVEESEWVAACPGSPLVEIWPLSPLAQNEP